MRYGQISFFNVLDPKIALPDWNSRQYLKTVGFVPKLYKTCFSGNAQDVLAKSHFWASNFQNRHTGLKFFRKLENSALSMKIVQNALFRSCAARFGQIAFFSVKVFKIVKLALNSFQSGKRVRFSGHAHFFKTEKQCAFLSVKVLKIVTLAWNSLQMGKTVRFSWKLSKTLFSGHAQHVLAKSHFGASKFSKSSRGPEILSKTRKQCAFNENCTQPSF